MIFVIGVDDSARVAANGRRLPGKSGVKGVRLIFLAPWCLAHRAIRRSYFQSGKSMLKNNGSESIFSLSQIFLSAPGVPGTEIRARRF
jgi:hypothetical protein